MNETTWYDIIAGTLLIIMTSIVGIQMYIIHLKSEPPKTESPVPAEKTEESAKEADK